MAENLMIQSHKSSTPAFREGWDRTFCDWREKRPFPFREYGYKVTIRNNRIEKMEAIHGISPSDIINRQMCEHDKEMQKKTERLIFTGKEETK